MQKFFETIESIDHFTLSLDCHKDTLECERCFKNDQFISHGFVYKRRYQGRKEAVGKRILCSNRFGHSGCGKTFRLTVATEIPSFQYGTVHLFVFIACLLDNLTVTESYQKAIGQSRSSRNAWGWLNKLMSRLSDYRTRLKVRVETSSNQFAERVKRLQHLLPSLARLINKDDISTYQYTYQTSFI